MIKEGKISTTAENLEIESDLIEYEIDKSNLNLKGNVEVKDDINNLVMKSDEINYDLKERKVTSSNSSEISDGINNIYKVSGFEYSMSNKIMYLIWWL